MKLKLFAFSGIVMTMALSAAPAFAGTSWKTFAGTLPRYQNWKQLSTDTNKNSSLAEAKVSNVGGSYKINLNIYDNKTKKQVSDTYDGASDNTLAKFNLDSSSQGHTVGLRGWTANWTIDKVEYSGEFRADS